MLAGLKRFYYQRKLKSIEASEPLLRCWNQSDFKFSENWRSKDFLVVDTETSSLSVEEGEILSIGWVVISAGQIKLSSAEHILLATQHSVGQSASIHQLRDCELVDGVSHREMMLRFLEVAANKILVFHHAPLDIGFLNLLSRNEFSAPVMLPVVDTLELEKKKVLRQSDVIADGALRLGNCRTRYGLSDLPAHNALMDALATAELLLAHIAHKGSVVKVSELIV
jgi:DNA polymerase-3 subunit epsilon